MTKLQLDYEPVEVQPGAFILFSTEPDVVPIQFLECSSKGDKRFSAFGAKVSMFGNYDSIENHYQLAKQFGDVSPANWRQAKGKIPSHLSINNKSFDVRFLTQWYKLLWLVYLDEHPELVAYACRFDKYTDMFRGDSINCQADVICQYVTKGRLSLEHDCEELVRELLT